MHAFHLVGLGETQIVEVIASTRQIADRIHRLNRRDFLGSGLCLGGAVAARAALALVPAEMPVLDSHIHLFDPTRSGGVPWPEASDQVLFKPALPPRYEQIARSFGVVGAIAIEASPLPTDNDWLLETAESSSFIVGIIGDLVPGSPGFAGELERLHRNPLFLGFRYGNLWKRDLVTDINRPGFMDGLKQLSQTRLVFESANPDPALIRTLAELAERRPDLTIVIDHLPHADPPASATARASYRSCLHTLGEAPGVFIKLSEIPRRINGVIPSDPTAYKENLDELWSIFGEEKILFGSDWPNSDHLLPYGETIGLLKRYASGKSLAAREKIFFRNSMRAYSWRPRLPDQRSGSRLR